MPQSVLKLVAESNPDLPRTVHKRPGDRGFTDWIGDFGWQDGKILIRKTGIRLPISWALIHEVCHWGIYLIVLSFVSFAARLRRGQASSIWFYPDCPGPWYLVRGAAIWGGLKLAKDAATADASIYFDDSTRGTPMRPRVPVRLNDACTDISKSHVANIFEEVFGYPLTVDPSLATGAMVEKPEKNGVHGGRIVTGPLIPCDGWTYQRVIDTEDDAGCCHDLRTPCAAGVPVVVWEKTKTPEGRFSIHNKLARLREPTEVYTTAELANIRLFCQRLGLDWGGLDILRDRHDGRIYIVDVNKTDLGPVIALSWRDKIASMNRLGKAIRALIPARE